jgi:hypothetical protein
MGAEMKKQYVYLILDQPLFKIGKTTDIKNRKKTYRCHNPKSQWVAQRLVDDASWIEDALIEELKELGFVPWNSSKEWFEGTFSYASFHHLVDKVVQRYNIEFGIFDDF